ncbi:MAG: glycosyltransferase family 2 protein, partial [Acidimicrobiales bacterium]
MTEELAEEPAFPVPQGAVDVSVVMPCLNEEASVGSCVERAWRGLARTGLRGEVIVCDNGSRDRSVEVAQAAGARVVHQARRGYGIAYLTGMNQARGWAVVMGDSDCSYDFLELDQLINPLLDGYEYVLGSRFSGNILPGAMPWLHRYVGNPVLTGVLNRLFSLPTTDAHSGMRAFTRDGYERMALRSEGMELASEIVIAGARAGLKMIEVPITYHPRVGSSKLHPWRDGWRHLRFMLAEARRQPRGSGYRQPDLDGPVPAGRPTGEGVAPPAEVVGHDGTLNGSHAAGRIDPDGTAANASHANASHANASHANGAYANGTHANGTHAGHANGPYADGHANGTHAGHANGPYADGPHANG